MSVSRRISCTDGGGNAMANATMPSSGGWDFLVCENVYCGRSLHSINTTWNESQITKNAKLKKKKHIFFLLLKFTRNRNKCTHCLPMGGDDVASTRTDTDRRKPTKSKKKKTIISICSKSKCVCSWPISPRRSVHSQYIYMHQCQMVSFHSFLFVCTKFVKINSYSVTDQ